VIKKKKKIRITTPDRLHNKERERETHPECAIPIVRVAENRTAHITQSQTVTGTYRTYGIYKTVTIWHI